MHQGKEVARLGDQHQYYSEPMPEAARHGPVVTLINATPDPLGSIAALCAMYTGRVIRSLSELNDHDRREALDAMLSTELNGALEAAQFHFLIEGVSRDFTHQAVRGRSAFYAQESLRFAVKQMWADEVQLPPSLQGALPPDDPRIIAWNTALAQAEDSYQQLVYNGVPAEEARKLLPHAVTTRYHWVCDLRELLHVAGLRTCTQAQFDWRLVMAQIAKALRKYGDSRRLQLDHEVVYHFGDGWQYHLIAEKLRPMCYQRGRCGFMAKFDRSCSIRERVEIRARNGGTDSQYWNRPFMYYDSDPVTGQPALKTSGPIKDEEWLTDPSAARK